jgi:hypothetical protein
MAVWVLTLGSLAQTVYTADPVATEEARAAPANASAN